MSAFPLGCLAPSFERTGIHSLDLLLDGLSILDSAFAVQVVQSRNVTVSPTLVPIRGGVMLTVTSILDTFPINCECNFGAILTTAKKLSDTAALCPIPTPRSGSNVTKMVYLLTKFSCITFYVDFSPAANIHFLILSSTVCPHLLAFSGSHRQLLSISLDMLIYHRH
jgi:hypothetical protein